jgi:hypothetical protein
MGSYSSSSYASEASRLPAALSIALQRDVGLSSAQYLANSAAAARAVEVVASLKSAGVDVLGSAVDGTHLTVNVASSSDDAVVAAAGASAVVGAPAPLVPDGLTLHSDSTTTYGGEGYVYSDAQGGEYRCSLGFNGYAISTGTGQFATAGHCATAINGTATLLTQTTADGTGTESISLGATVSGEAAFGNGLDYGIVGSGSSAAPQPSELTWGGSNGAPLSSAPLAITGETAATVGATICKSGSTSGWTCGTILGVDQPVTVRDDNNVAHTVNGIVSNVCMLPGDSGGGAVIGTLAAGIDSASSFTDTSSTCAESGESVFFPMVSATGSSSVSGEQGTNWEPAVSVSTPVVTAPTNGETVDPTTSIAGTLANASTRSTVSLYLDGSSTAAATVGASSGSWSFPLSTYPAGSHSFSIIARWGTWSTSSASTGTFTETAGANTSTPAPTPAPTVTPTPTPTVAPTPAPAAPSVRAMWGWGFESGTAGWGRFTPRMYISTPRNRRFAHSGQRYLQVTNRLVNSTTGIGVGDAVQAGDDDGVVVWLRAARAGTVVTVTLEATGGPAESTEVSVAVPRQWIPVTLNLPIADAGHAGLGILVTTASRSRTIYIDDVTASSTR